MSNKHTPGSWVMTKGDRDALHIGPDVRDRNGNIIAFVSYDGAPCGDGNEANCNARLIAAAPELLDALRTMLVATTDDGKEQFPGHYAAYLETVAKPRALEAIRNATEVQS